MAKRRPLTVQMEDNIQHTIAHPVCDDPECICAELEYQQLIADQVRTPAHPHHKKPLVEKQYDVLSSELNYRNRGFRLLK